MQTPGKNRITPVAALQIDHPTNGAHCYVVYDDDSSEWALYVPDIEDANSPDLDTAINFADTYLNNRSAVDNDIDAN